MIPKFRAWDNKRKLMIDEVVVIDLYHEYIGYLYASRIVQAEIVSRLPINDVIIMQSTGLFDKNGKEIFEGDVVRYTWDMPSDVNATEKGKKVRISKVFWSDWRASWAIGKKCCNNDLFRYARNGNTVEIIGNIYQNQELLEEE